MTNPTILQELAGAILPEQRQAWIEILQRRDDEPITKALKETVGRSLIKRFARFVGEDELQEFADNLIREVIEEL